MKIRLHYLVFFSTLVIIGIFTFMIASLFDRGEIVFTNIQEYSGPLVTRYNPYTGSPNPEVRLVLYSNFTCPNCADFSQAARDSLADRNAVLVWKDIPNDSLHPYSTKASLAAHCAGDVGLFWQYHDVLMAKKGDLQDSTFAEIATQLGMNPNRLTRCMEKGTFQPVIDQSIDEANQLKITTAPTLYVGNDRFATGTINISKLRERMDIILGL